MNKKFPPFPPSEQTIQYDEMLPKRDEVVSEEVRSPEAEWRIPPMTVILTLLLIVFVFVGYVCLFGWK